MSEFTPVEETPSTSAPIVPHSREAEEAVIGSILINPETYYDVAQFLQFDDFYIHRHQWIWQCFTRLHERRTPIDFLTVSEELDQMGQLAEVGGPAYLTALINNVPTSLHAEAYGRIVEQNSIRRRMLTAANTIAKLAYQEDHSIDSVMDEAEKAVFGVSERRMTRDLQTIQQVLSDYYDRIDQLASRGEEAMGVPTGFIDLDRLLGGLQPSDLLIIAGRPGTGKTAFMLSAAKNAAQVYKKHVAVFSLEMSNEQLVHRLISQETGIDSQRLRTGKLNEEEWPLFTHAIEVLSDTRIFLDDTPALTPLQLRTKARRLHLEFQLDLILVDYLQLMSSGTRSENRVQEVSYISRNLKVLARELNVPVLAAAQLSRAVEQRADKEPQLSDLRESGCLTGDTLIALSTGEYKPIVSLVGQQPEVFTLDEWRIMTQSASRVWLTGNRPVFKLRLRSGRTIRATGNHKFRSLEGWHALERLKSGDRIAVPRSIPEPEKMKLYYIKSRIKDLGVSQRQMAAMRGTAYGGDAHFGFAPSRRTLDHYATLLADDTMHSIADSDIYWDTIVSIEPDGVEDVYDMTVPDTHNFIANGIVVHNSLEQDADIVMFINRPELYEKDTLKQNIAQIKVAKHRNGPVGTIELVFRGSLAKFENAATRRVDLSQVA